MSETKDKFESGIFWELYLDLERQFQNFLGYVPYLDGNEDVYSFKLLNLILGIGGHIDSAFKEMARYPKFSNNDDCKKILELLKKSEKNIKKGKAPITIPITVSLRAFEKEYKLSKREVFFKSLPEGEEVTPFKPYNPKTKAPEWWEIYNGLKHDVSINIQKANLKNTRDALAGAFLLNVRHIPAAGRICDYGVIKSAFTESGALGITGKGFREILENEKEYAAFAETPLFVYDYCQ